VASGFVHGGEEKLPVMRLEHLDHTGKVGAKRKYRLCRYERGSAWKSAREGCEEDGGGCGIELDTETMVRNRGIELVARRDR
jgi:hypothetical protein